MEKEMVSSNSQQNSEISDETPKRRPKKKLVISPDEAEIIMAISEKVKSLRKSMNLGSEDFALKAGVNRNTFFRFEQSAQTGENYTVAILLKVIRGLDMTVDEFFKDIK
jgi:DNA-binding XRE family transcriptional regulator